MSFSVNETVLKTRVLRMISKEFPNAWVWKTSDRFTSGIPDLLIINMGCHIFIELKTGAGSVKPIQEFTIGQIKKSGGQAFVCRSVAEVKEVINESTMRQVHG